MTEETKPEKKETKPEKKEKEMFNSVYGLVSPEDFKKLYADVFEGTADRDHLINGYATHSADLGVVLGKVSARTLRKVERSFIQMYAPLSGDMEEAELAANMTKFNDLTLLFALDMADGNNFEIDLSKLEPNLSYEALLKVPAVEKKLEYLRKLPNESVAYALHLITDVAIAFDRALRAALVNPLNPV